MFKIDAPEVKAVIDKHKRTGHIVDFYSEEHVANLDIDSAPITIGDLKEYDRKYGADYRGHLLTVYLGDHQQELFNDLCHCYPSFKQILTLKNQYGGAMHKPALLIINVKTREILCAGLGKKNVFFSYELHRYLKNWTTCDEENKLLGKFTSDQSIECSKAFFDLDHFEVAYKTMRWLKTLGDNFREYDHLPGDADVMVTRNEQDGLYYLDDYAYVDGMTESDVKELSSDYERCAEWIDDCQDSLRWFFPKLEDWDLNTGDY
jgi:hypothetical protein